MDKPEKPPANPHEWLERKIDAMRDEKFSEVDLRMLCRLLASVLSEADITGLFEDEMQASGYWNA